MTLLNPYRFATGGGGAGGFIGATRDFGENGVASLAPNKPDGVVSGDLLIFLLTTRNSLPDTDGPEGDNSWATAFKVGVGSSGVTDPFSSGDEVGAAWYRLAGASEPANYPISITDLGTDGSVAFVVALRGPTAFDGYAIEGGTTVAPSVAGTAGGWLIGYFATSADSGTFDSAPPEMTEAVKYSDGDSNAVKGLVAYEGLVATGATGTRTVGHTDIDAFEFASLLAFS